MNVAVGFVNSKKVDSLIGNSEVVGETMKCAVVCHRELPYNPVKRESYET